MLEMARRQRGHTSASRLRAQRLATTPKHDKPMREVVVTRDAGGGGGRRHDGQHGDSPLMNRPAVDPASSSANDECRGGGADR